MKIQIQCVSENTLQAIDQFASVLHAYVMTQPQSESLEAQNLITVCKVIQDCVKNDLSTTTWDFSNQVKATLPVA